MTGEFVKNSLHKFIANELTPRYSFALTELKGKKLKSALIYYCDFVMTEHTVCQFHSMRAEHLLENWFEKLCKYGNY